MKVELDQEFAVNDSPVTASELSGTVSFSMLYTAFLLKELPRLSAFSVFSTRDAADRGRYSTLKRAVQLASNRAGLNLEFGVYKGRSLELCAKLWPGGRFYGFDSFEGFPDDGRLDWNHDFSVKDIPVVPSNCTLIPGFFDTTLPKFLSEHDEEINFLNVDCDIYSSTKTIFDEIERVKKFKSGVIIHFDELINYKEYLWNEMLALFDFLINTGRSPRWLACHGPVRSVDLTLRLLSEGNFPSWGEDKKNGFRQQATMVLQDEPIDFSELRIPHFRKRVAEMTVTLERLTRKVRPDLLELVTRKV